MTVISGPDLSLRLAGLAVLPEFVAHLLPLLQRPTAGHSGDVHEPSAPPLSGVMKPKPLSWLKNLTDPVAMSLIVLAALCRLDYLCAKEMEQRPL
jgi:hypothetical protein